MRLDLNRLWARAQFTDTARLRLYRKMSKMLSNGLPLLKKIGGIDFSAAGPKFIVNGLILLLFASIDATSRRRASAN